MNKEHNDINQEIQSQIDGLPLPMAQKETIKSILEKRIFYIPDVRFANNEYMNVVMELKVIIPYGTSMTEADEQTVFKQLNFARYHMSCLRRRILKYTSGLEKDAQNLLYWYYKYLEIRSKIVTGNLGLVFFMIRRTKFLGVEHSDLISEGSMALLRATDKFDYLRGIKFCTYARHAIQKGFLKAAKQNNRYRSLFPIQLDTILENDNVIELKRQRELENLTDEARTIVKKNLAKLSNIEMSVVRKRFALDNRQKSPLSLKQVGDQCGLSKERIRQIQKKAISKLQGVANDRMLAT